MSKPVLLFTDLINTARLGTYVVLTGALLGISYLLAATLGCFMTHMRN